LPERRNEQRAKCLEGGLKKDYEVEGVPLLKEKPVTLHKSGEGGGGLSGSEEKCKKRENNRGVPGKIRI